MAYTIGGEWVFIDEPDWVSLVGTNIVVDVNFKSNNINFYRMEFVGYSIGYFSFEDPYSYVEVYHKPLSSGYGEGWANPSYRIVDFGEPQEVTDKQYSAIRANAIPVIGGTDDLERYGSRYIISKNTLTNIADAIRAKNGTSTQYRPPEMAAAVLAIDGSGITPTGTLVINENGTYNVTNYASAEVDVDITTTPAVIEPLEITENGTYTASNGIDGYSPITVNVTGSGGSGEGFWNENTVKSFVDRSITALNLPNSVTSIGDYAFYKYTNLASISLNNNITNIGRNAFQDCTNLVLTALPDNITSIGYFTFGGCRNLNITSMPESLTKIQLCAFQDCTGLTTLTFEGTPTLIASDAFDGCTNLRTINVPWAEGAVANAPWGATNATINYNYIG